MSSSTLEVAFASITALAFLGRSHSLEIGSQVCAEGFIMDKFCIQRGTLLDAPSVKTLLNPERHSLHCLVDVGRCVNSGYEILVDPSEGQDMYRRAWTIDDAGNSELINLARKTGKRGFCSTCRDELGVSQERGFRATVFGEVLDMGSSNTPATLTNVRVESSSVGCEQYIKDNNLTMSDMMPPAITGDGTETFLGDARTHGALMTVGWGLLLPSGAIIAKFGKHRPNALWFKAHRVVQVIGLIVATAGFVIALNKFDAFSQKGFDAYTHACLGTAAMSIAFFQPVNALVRPHPPSEEEEKGKITARLIWEIVHKVLGWIGCLLAAITIGYGTTLIPDTEGDQKKFQLGYGIGCGLFLVLLTVTLLVDKKLNPPQKEEILPSSTVATSTTSSKP